MCVIFHHFSTIGPTGLLHPSPVPNFKIFRISNLLSEVSKFQHHTLLRSKCSTSLVSSLNLSPVVYIPACSYMGYSNSVISFYTEKQQNRYVCNVIPSSLSVRRPWFNSCQSHCTWYKQNGYSGHSTSIHFISKIKKRKSADY